ncbi:MAG: cysteine desulfurase NifS [Candidatus Omnitrophica bacterium CG11_big_fil_rev_8_21_14_0_20_64_10]|nr:MAG: cysteine desulfurase NifS [Candidatus Omnitrophica bacterium CG11_big_fil_rev_8_21_14_0_20_64_10]
MIYFDYNATTPLLPEVESACRPLFGTLFGNPSSLHRKGQEARAALEGARRQLLAALGDEEGILLFTSGGTESDNLALKGAARALRSQGDHLIVSAVEHSAVLNSARALAREGFRVEILPVDEAGRIDPAALEQRLTDRTILISVMQANNEVGTIQPVAQVGAIARGRGILFHTDAVQSFGKLPLNVRSLPADLVSISAHKIGGPKGAGALYLRRGTPLEPLFHGGPHEGNRRAGTEGLLGIVGMAAAAQAAMQKLAGGESNRLAALRDRLEEGLLKRVPDAVRNGPADGRIPNTAGISFLGCDGEILLQGLDLAGICVSTGSACAAGSRAPSHVLRAMGLAEERIAGSVRFSIGWKTTEAEIDQVLREIPPIVERVRAARRSIR